MRILFLRHAHAVSQIDKSIVIGRAHEAPLSDRGREQAFHTAEVLAKAPIGAIYASTCVRALQTAAPIALSLGLEVIPAESLVERSQGDLEGLKKEIAYTPEVERIIHADQWRWKPPNGESLEETAARVESFLANLAKDPPKQTPLAVTHQMLLWSVFYRCTRCDHTELPKLKFNNCALAEIEYAGPNEWSLIRWNALPA